MLKYIQNSSSSSSSSSSNSSNSNSSNTSSNTSSSLRCNSPIEKNNIACVGDCHIERFIAASTYVGSLIQLKLLANFIKIARISHRLAKQAQSSVSSPHKFQAARPLRTQRSAAHVTSRLSRAAAQRGLGALVPGAVPKWRLRSSAFPDATASGNRWRGTLH